jgi:3'-phosphoadenosine 5'-phosphosulfate (PAPS) 3'-phosphatase
MAAGESYEALILGEQAYSLFQILNAWDHAPGLAIVQALGGASGLSDGQAFPASGHSGRPDRALITARSSDLWHRVGAIVRRQL